MSACGTSEKKRWSRDAVGADAADVGSGGGDGRGVVCASADAAGWSRDADAPDTFACPGRMKEDDDRADDEDEAGIGRDARCGRGAAVTVAAASPRSCNMLAHTMRWQIG